MQQSPWSIAEGVYAPVDWFTVPTGWVAQLMAQSTFAAGSKSMPVNESASGPTSVAFAGSPTEKLTTLVDTFANARSALSATVGAGDKKTHAQTSSDRTNILHLLSRRLRAAWLKLQHQHA